MAEKASGATVGQLAPAPPSWPADCCCSYLLVVVQGWKRHAMRWSWRQRFLSPFPEASKNNQRSSLSSPTASLKGCET